MTESRSRVGFLVAGERVQGSGTPFSSVDPATGEVNYEVAAAGAEDVARCVEAAQEAVARPGWRDMRPHERARILSAIADGIVAKADDLAAIQRRENGKVLAECRTQVASAAATFRYYAGVCETTGSEVTPSRGDYLSMTTYEPVGVVAAITPWNSPLTMEAQKIAPALAAGNAVIVKPSEVTPTAAIAVAEIALAAGLPPGLLNVLTGTGTETGVPLVRHPGVRMVSFTGGTETGRAIAQIAAGRLIPAALELGGKSPHIVFADADLDRAAAAVQDGIFEGSGQSCVAGSRLFVERKALDRMVALMRERATSLKVGMPLAPDSRMGPLASFRQRETVERFVQSARDEGGEIIAGGARPDDAALAAGAFYLPTLIGGLDGSARVVREEIFGPVLCILPFDDEEDLIAQANGTAFGLASGIWTSDVTRALRIARRIEAGTVWINTYKQLSIATPFGGYKDSGLGREKGIGGMRLYQQAKSIYLGGVKL
ncbi:aldehyde dehydrogenase [Enterovirga rhinocerotis]|uniref:Acyl-CoA reductase-like NAD-dependent aldehyde dehydrogenase n=1 Tax=Enterovirga rhinocerotis TaxID=1339210 RepID=A0A4R7BJH4_9HYPH|nr:aldehyde dehydrogenase [Enterovirga rhinocerotis]TDR85494.1 acyl-CoA reductase-like NAD-dependent aldehyde dehydrogenase [Enterovirga rhinocerotis]